MKERMPGRGKIDPKITAIREAPRDQIEKMADELGLRVAKRIVTFGPRDVRIDYRVTIPGRLPLTRSLIYSGPAQNHIEAERYAIETIKLKERSKKTKKGKA